MNVVIRLTIAVAITTVCLCADTIEYESLGGGGPLGFYIPQFDPSLGTLESMTFNVSVGEVIQIPIPNCFFDTTPIVDYSYDITARFSIFGSSVSSEQSGSDSVGSTCGGFSEPGYTAGIDVSGSISDMSAFVGTGDMSVPTSDYLAAGVFSYGGFPSYAVSSYPGPGGIFIEPASGYLEVIYDYTAVPEPNILPLTLLLVGALFLSRGRRRKLRL